LNENEVEQMLRDILNASGSRSELWQRFVTEQKIRRVLELGVYRGEFAEWLLKQCDTIENYYMIDPWRHLERWNKPANVPDQEFEGYFQEVLRRTDFAAHRRVVLRGRTTEVIERIPDGELDFAYIDGDHTLRGITIDLIRVYPKLRVGGWIGGDDFSSSIWQHATAYEPTLVFPFAVYFAEAVGANLFALPYSQFLMRKNAEPFFTYQSLVRGYGETDLKGQLGLGKMLHLKLAETGKWIAKQRRLLTKWMKIHT